MERDMEKEHRFPGEIRVLWLTNIMLPVYARRHGLVWSDREGWLTGSFDRIVAAARDRVEGWNTDQEIPPISLGIAFPAEEPYCWVRGTEPETIEGVAFYGFSEDLRRPEIYDHTLENKLLSIADDFRPDVIHCYGTEFPHSLAMARVCRRPETILVSLQGIAYIYAKKFMGALPENVAGSVTFRDIVRKDSLRQQQQKMEERGYHEKELLKRVFHVAGRTGFDREAALSVNPDLTYHFLGETMRSVFYRRIERGEMMIRHHSIFVTQGDVPYKGFHLMLEAMSVLIRTFPDAQLFVAGNSVTGTPDRSSITVEDEQAQRGSSPAGRRQGNTEDEETGPSWISIRINEFKNRIKTGAYGKYLQTRIEELSLEKHITILGPLSAAQVREQLLKCETFVCPSYIENSPNSLAEAMLLGRPCVAADVGGISDMAGDGKEVLLFPEGNANALAAAVTRLWTDSRLERELGEAARDRAFTQHDPDANYKTLIGIYEEMVR